MNKRSLLIASACLMVFLSACQGGNTVPTPLPSSTITNISTPSLTPTPSVITLAPSETPTPTPALHTIETGINTLNHTPTQAELANLSTTIIAEHPEIKPETTFYDLSGDPTNVNYRDFPFYYSIMLPRHLILEAITQTPDGYIASMLGYGNYLDAPVVLNFVFDNTFMTDNNLTAEQLQTIFNETK